MMICNIVIAIKLVKLQLNAYYHLQYGYRALLHIAVDNGNNDIVEALLSRGADPSIISKVTTL